MMNNYIYVGGYKTDQLPNCHTPRVINLLFKAALLICSENSLIFDPRPMEHLRLKCKKYYLT